MSNPINDSEYHYLLNRSLRNMVPVEFRQSAITPVGVIQNYIAALEFALEHLGVEPSVAINAWRDSVREERE